ncbi:protein TonB [Desulfovibrio legallii]|uniref:Protein TonB n=1 Tax=Desulfovibrio legallii TaxID=571438 RepID=A0A1G7PBM0_9BACT|nr:protein TonB [Desulfovibrio legallii]
MRRPAPPPPLPLPMASAACGPAAADAPRAAGTPPQAHGARSGGSAGPRAAQTPPRPSLSLPPLPLPHNLRAPFRRGLFSALLLHAAVAALVLAAPLTNVGKRPAPLLRVSLVSLAPGNGAATPAPVPAPAQAAPATVTADGAAAPPRPSTAETAPTPPTPVQAAPRPKPAAKPRPAPKPRARPAAPPTAPQDAPPRPAPSAVKGLTATAPPAPAGPPGGSLAAGQTAGTPQGDPLYAPNQLDRPPTVTRPVRPDYPDRARSRRLEGRVVVRLVVESSGLPGHCSVHAAQPRGYFEDAALEAARRMRFRPGRKDGRAVRTVVLLPFDFRLQ